MQRTRGGRAAGLVRSSSTACFADGQMRTRSQRTCLARSSSTPCAADGLRRREPQGASGRKALANAGQNISIIRPSTPESNADSEIDKALRELFLAHTFPDRKHCLDIERFLVAQAALARALGEEGDRFAATSAFLALNGERCTLQEFSSWQRGILQSKGLSSKQIPELVRRAIAVCDCTRQCQAFEGSVAKHDHSSSKQSQIEQRARHIRATTKQRAQQTEENMCFGKSLNGMVAAGAVQGFPAASKFACNAALVDLFGESLLTKQGVKTTNEVLGGKSAIGIYFSAHWCPPCRFFTPELAAMYSSVFMSKGMEIVFSSADLPTEKGAPRAASFESFERYYGEMPWAAVPYEKRETMEKLMEKYHVQSLPSLVIIGPDGSTINVDGRKAVSKDPSGNAYPWIPPTVAEKARIVIDSLGPDLMKKVQGKSIGLYFSAHWCPPCRGFTPKLAELYKDGFQDKIEIIFVSSDRDLASFNKYFSTMPWLALPFDQHEEKEALSDIFGISGIPSLVILNADGTLITTEGVRHVMADPRGQHFPDGWQGS